MTADDRTPPPLRCPRHLDNPTEQACRGCGAAREARALWEALDQAEEQDQDAALVPREDA